MVMVTDGAGRRGSGASQPREGAVTATAGAAAAARGEDAALHDRLVAYVRAVDDGNESRSGVWGEHSYARARGGGGAGAGAGAVRVLLGAAGLCAVGEPGLTDPLDVERASPPPPDFPDPDYTDPPFGDDSDADDEEWEERVVSLAPSSDHAALASFVSEAVGSVRLSRLAGGRAAARVTLRAAAARLRRALAPLWLKHTGPANASAPAWMHSTMMSVASPSARRTYERIVNELRRMAPALATRLAGPRATPLPGPPPIQMVDASSSPWVIWVGPSRWGRLLGARVHTRIVGAGGVPGPPAPPDAWCAAFVGGVRAAAADVMAEAGDRPVIVGGAGGCASLARALAAEGGARGALLLAPALVTAGARDPAPPASAPTLLVVGGKAAQAGPADACDALGPGTGGLTRVLVVASADDELRLPARLLRRKKITQRALDAAIVEECVRWLTEMADFQHEPASEYVADSSEEEYAHLPAGAPAAPTPPPPPLAVTSGNHRSIEIVEGRVVSRGAGGTPLALLPPRRLEPQTPTAGTHGLAAADIMHMPIVFADDEPPAVKQPPTPPPPAPTPTPSSDVTVTSGGGKLKYTRVIVAKRGGGSGGERPPRPLLLRRGLRLVPRH